MHRASLPTPNTPSCIVGTIVTDATDHGASVVLDETARTASARVVDGDELVRETKTRFSENDKVVITSENVLDTVLQRMDDPNRIRLIDSLKNKNRCREMIRDLYPDFFFKRVSLEALPTVELPPNKRFIVKPNRGYFATAIKLIDAQSDLRTVTAEIEADILKNAAVFADTVLSNADVIIEDYITGEEYAVDMFYDDDGKPVIVNLFHHPIPENPDYLHALYYTSKPIFDALHDRLVDWFDFLNQTLMACNFPIHAEFRVSGQTITPIELNPLRYGGDGLVDLSYHAFGVNAYAAFFENKAPDWAALWQGREEKIYTWMMGYVGSDVDVESHRPNIGAFHSLFSNILSDAVLNYEAHLGFSVIYSEESDIEAVYKLVNTDFKALFLGQEMFSEEALARLYRSGVVLHLSAGETVWREGDIGDYLLLVTEGTLEVLHETQADQQILLDTIGARSVVGEYAVMDGRPRTAGVRVGPQGCTAVRINGDAFRKLLREAPGLFEELYWQQQMRIRKMNKRIGDLELELSQLR